MLTHLAFSPDGRLLAAGSTDHTAKLWKPFDRRTARPDGPRWHPCPPRGSTRPGTELVTASMDHDARIWDLATDTSIRTLSRHLGKVSDAGFSPDGRWVVTAGPGKAGLWDARSGSLLFFLQGHTRALTERIVRSGRPNDRDLERRRHRPQLRV